MKKHLFNDNWIFAEGAGNGLFASLTGGTNAPVTVNLPHDAVIGTSRVHERNLGSVGFYKARNVNYTKKFTVPVDWADKSVFIEFEGIYQNAAIYVNNSYAGSAFYGYGGHYFDIKRFLRPGQENEIRVLVKNGANPAGRWYTGGGIYRDVWLHTGSYVHIVPTGTRVSTESVEADQATVLVVTPIVHDGTDVVTAYVKNEILDSYGNVVAQETIPVTCFDHAEKCLRQRLIVPAPQLWDAESPNLYTIRTTVNAGGCEVDSYTDSFGIRSMQLDAKKGLRINGKTVKLRGGCIHHDNGVVGSATFYDSEERRVRIMKQMGYNAIRMSHHPASKALLRACDKLGMYVMDEFADVWTSAKSDFDYGVHMPLTFENDVAQMVYKDFNHPSVILYSIGNEIPENGNRFDVSYGRKIVDIIRSIDSDRYILNSINIMLAMMEHMDELIASMGGGNDGDPATAGGEINAMMASLGDIMGSLSTSPISSRYIEEACGQLDLSGYNYAEDRYESDAQLYPNRVLVGSETFPAKLAKNWALVKKLPNVIGDFVWTSWDYLGESGIGKNSYLEDPDGGMMHMNMWPLRIAMCGTVDLNGVPQPVAYWRQIVWGLAKGPYINVCPPEVFGKTVNLSAWGWSDGQNTWTWTGSEGKKMDVDVYADADEVELFINGVSVGKKAVGEKLPYVATFQVVYQPGEIRAVAVKNGISAEQILYTAGKSDLSVRAESEKIDVLTGVGYVDISFRDEKGILDPCTTATVSVSVEGGILQGFGSTDAESDENFTGNTFKTYRGRLLAVVRALEPGQVNVSVQADGYAPQTVFFTAE